MSPSFTQARWFTAFGLRLQSRYPLPASLDVAGPSGSADVIITLEAIAPRSSSLKVPRARTWRRDAEGAVLRFEDQQGYLLEVRFDPAGTRMDVRFSRPEEEVGGILLGVAMAALLHLRGIPTLHATALRVGDRGFALAGPAGAGKSTLAAAMIALGGVLLTDDVTPFRFDDARVEVQPGGRTLGLCPDVVAHAEHLLGVTAGAVETDGKRRIDPHPTAVAGPRAVGLQAIYLIRGRLPHIQTPQVTRLPAPLACAALTRLIYGVGWLDLSEQEVLDRSGGLANRVAVFEVWLPDGLQHLGRSAAALRRHIEGGQL